VLITWNGKALYFPGKYLKFLGLSRLLIIWYLSLVSVLVSFDVKSDKYNCTTCINDFFYIITIICLSFLLSFSPNFRPMASSSDSWLKEYNEAMKLADDISGMISEHNSFPSSGPETQRHASAIRRKITILGTRLDSLQSLLSKLPVK
jgi:hypothetical protein